MDHPKSRLGAFLWYHIKKERWTFPLLLCCLSIWAVNEALFPYFLRVMINSLDQLGSTPFSWDYVKFPLIGLAISWTAMEVGMRVYGLICHFRFPKLRERVRMQLFHYQTLQSKTYFNQNFAGKIASKLNDLPRAVESIANISLFSIFAISITFVISLWLLFRIGELYALIMCLWAIAHLSVTFICLREINKNSEIHSECNSNLNGQLIDAITHMPTVQVFASGIFEFKRITQGLQKEEIQKSKDLTFATEKANAIRGVLTLILMSFIFWGLLQGYQQKLISIGELSQVAFSTFNVMGLLWHMSFQLNVLFREIGQAQAALDLLSAPLLVKDRGTTEHMALPPVGAQIKFEKVSFRYEENTPLLFNQLSFTIERGEKVGVVGLSGSGKTTLVHLLLRFYDLESGSITIEGHDIASLKLNYLRELISMIPQDTSLFHRTLKENIAYGRKDASMAHIEKAVEEACAQSFIDELPLGLNTLVGERGVKLSGGQRQRVAMARAFLKKAPILVLDEATSALDSETEGKIQKGLKNLMAKQTTLVVAHRLSTLRDMDRILVFSKGQLIEQGSLANLLALKGHFHHLWRKQVQGILPENLKDEFTNESENERLPATETN